MKTISLSGLSFRVLLVDIRTSLPRLHRKNVTQQVHLSLTFHLRHILLQSFHKLRYLNLHLLQSTQILNLFYLFLLGSLLFYFLLFNLSLLLGIQQVRYLPLEPKLRRIYLIQQLRHSSLEPPFVLFCQLIIQHYPRIPPEHPL